MLVLFKSKTLHWQANNSLPNDSLSCAAPGNFSSSETERVIKYCVWPAFT